MSSFGSSSGAQPSEGEMMDAIKQEMAVAFLQEFYQTVRDKCFAACVTKPSSSLSSSEQQCLSKCCDRYADATGVVTRAVLEASGVTQ